jgi:type I restriction enzyme S subunit
MIDWASCDHLSTFRYEESPEIQLQTGDVILSKDGSIGNPALIGDLPGRATINGTMMMIRPHSDHLVPSYLYQVVCGADFHRLIREKVSGSSIPHIFQRDIVHFPVVLPPLDEQRRIAEVLRSVDEAIAANQDALGQVARARSAILHTAFEETPWEAVPLGELGTWQSGGTPPKADDALWGGDVPWVCPRDMKTPVIRQTHSTLTPLALGGSCKLAPKGTLMIVVRGMILAKAIPTATTAMDATFNQDMKAFRPNGRALPKFVQLCLQHQERQLLRVVNTATHGTKKLDTDTLLAVSVPLPDLETQQELADAVSDLDFASVKYGEEHIRLSMIKHALMSDLLSGRVRVPA